MIFRYDQALIHNLSSPVARAGIGTILLSSGCQDIIGPYPSVFRDKILKNDNAKDNKLNQICKRLPIYFTSAFKNGVPTTSHTVAELKIIGSNEPIL